MNTIQASSIRYRTQTHLITITDHQVTNHHRRHTRTTIQMEIGRISRLILSTFLLTVASLMAVLVMSQLQQVQASTEIDFHGDSISADGIKRPDQWPQVAQGFVTCRPLAPCFVESVQDMKAVLGAYPLAIVGIDPYYLYDATDFQQKANQKQCLNVEGLENADEKLPNKVQESED